MLKGVLVGLCCALCLLSSTARAVQHRHVFEPTDLNFDARGVLDIDAQFGLMRDGQSWRAVLPDFEVDVGITSWLELDLDGTFALASHSRSLFPPSTPTPDNLWLSTKIGLLDTRDDEDHSSWALGVRQGPRLPAARDTSSLGYEALLLLGRTMPCGQFVLNLGAFVDPAVYRHGRPAGVSFGLDATLPWAPHPDFAVIAQVFGGWYPTGDPSELAASAGLQWSPTDMLDLSLIGMGGSLAGGAAYGVLFGVSPMLRLLR